MNCILAHYEWHIVPFKQSPPAERCHHWRWFQAASRDDITPKFLRWSHRLQHRTLNEHLFLLSTCVGEGHELHVQMLSVHPNGWFPITFCPYDYTGRIHRINMPQRKNKKITEVSNSTKKDRCAPSPEQEVVWVMKHTTIKSWQTL